MRIENLKRFRWVIALLIIFSSLFVFSQVAQSADSTYSVSGKKYEGDENSNHETTTSVSSFSYGKDSVGMMAVKGDIHKTTTFNGKTAYGVNDTIAFRYVYNGEYQDSKGNQWYLENDKCKTVAGIDTKQIQKGAIIIQKSADGTTWENACDPYYDFFDKNKKKGSADLDLYTTTEDEIRAGTYYRVYVAYEMWLLTKDAFWDWDKEYNKRRCTEVYEFYVCSDKNYVVLKNIDDQSLLANNATVNKGFFIDTSGSSASITVSRDGGTPVTAGNASYKTDKGKYQISITTKLGEKFSEKVEISEGTSLQLLSATVFESKDGEGYTEKDKIQKNCFGNTSITQLKLGTRYGYNTTQSTYNGRPAYGVTGDAVGLYLSLECPSVSDWEVVYDKWGAKDKEKVNGVDVKQVGKGALIVQRSMDGTNWYTIDDDRYAGGLYTTDYGTHYKNRENILIYTPDGASVLNGIYIRVFYAAEVYQQSTKTTKNYLEKYEFYLCDSELDAVTFHNLSATGMIDEMFGDEDEDVVEVYKKAESMLSGSTTVTGFQVDTGENKTVTYEISKNGNKISQSTTGKYTASGKYDITLHSKVGDTKKVTIYVDGNSPEQALKTYFGDGFISSGKRIYAEGEYPVYEAGTIKYHIEKISDEYVPISGQIRNIDPGATTVIDIKGTRETKSGTLKEKGNYEAVFTTYAEGNGQEASGDYRTFTFHFRLIEEGTAPGPVINQQNLYTFTHSFISDSYPIYYGVIYKNAAQNDNTYAFRTFEDAKKFAADKEKNKVEPQPDGTYRYTGDSLELQKDVYDNEWDLMDKIDEYAESMVQRIAFDMSDPYTYTTLPDSELAKTKLPEEYLLRSSVVIFGEGQKALLTDLDCLPIINNKDYCYILPGDDSKPQHEDKGFQFIHDKYGCDSETVEITDCEGNVHKIEYNKDVALQLKRDGCPTGVITITETTAWDDSVSYQAIYFQDGDNTSEVEVTYYENGVEKKLVVNKDNAIDIDFQADAFYVSGFTDELDKYALITVKKSGSRNKEAYAADQLVKDAWSNAGDYEVSAINRLGYKFSFNVHVNNSERTTLNFRGPGTEDVRAKSTYFGAKDLDLPELSRDGYVFDGFVDEEGNRYREKIEEVHLKGEHEFTAVWIPTECEIVLKNHLDEEIDRYTADYDSMFRLPTPQLDEGVEFVSWTRDGAEVDGEIRVDDGEIVLVAKVRDTSTGLIVGESAEPEDVQQDIPQENKKKFPIIPVILIVALVGIVAMIAKKRKGPDVKNDEPDQGNGSGPDITLGHSEKKEDEPAADEGVSEVLDLEESAADQETEKPSNEEQEGNNDEENN